MKELCLKHGIGVCRKSEPTMQMVLGTDNQEKEVPHAGLPPMAPELPDASFPYPKVPPYLGAPPPQKPTQVGPLVETGGEFRPAEAHKPFFLLELRQIQ